MVIRDHVISHHRTTSEKVAACFRSFSDLISTWTNEKKRKEKKFETFKDSVYQYPFNS
jgi:hypothetical protein